MGGLSPPLSKSGGLKPPLPPQVLCPCPQLVQLVARLTSGTKTHTSGSRSIVVDSDSSTPSPIHLRMPPPPPAPTQLHVRSYFSPVDTASSAGSRGYFDEAYHSTAASPSYLNVMEAEDFRWQSRALTVETAFRPMI